MNFDGELFILGVTHNRNGSKRFGIQFTMDLLGNLFELYHIEQCFFYLTMKHFANTIATVIQSFWIKNIKLTTTITTFLYPDYFV